MGFKASLIGMATNVKLKIQYSQVYFKSTLFTGTFNIIQATLWWKMHFIYGWWKCNTHMAG